MKWIEKKIRYPYVFKKTEETTTRVRIPEKEHKRLIEEHGAYHL